MHSRTAGRALVAAVAAAALILARAAPALADPPVTWSDPEPISMLEALLVFVGIPIALSVVIALLVMAPSVAKGPRYRPGLGWWAEPEWFGGPQRGADAEGAEDASRPALESGIRSPELPAGGTSARW